MIYIYVYISALTHGCTYSYTKHAQCMVTEAQIRDKHICIYTRTHLCTYSYTEHTQCMVTEVMISNHVEDSPRKQNG